MAALLREINLLSSLLSKKADAISIEGLEHTRFQHALGAMHLATKAVASLRKQGIQVIKSELNEATT